MWCCYFANILALPLLCLLLLLSGGLQRCAGQVSVPVVNTTQFADALNNQAIAEIILDPSGTGVRHGMLAAAAQ